MSGVSDGSAGPSGERPGLLLVCCDPRSPRMVAAHQVLCDLGETAVARSDEAATLLSKMNAGVVVAEEWLGTSDGRTFLAWATRTRASAVGILLASSRATTERD